VTRHELLRRRTLFGAGLIAVLAIFSVVTQRETTPPSERCGPAFSAVGARCCEADGKSKFECTLHRVTHRRVPVPAADFELVATDWEADDRVPPMKVHTAPFWVDAYERTEGDVDPNATDPARARSGISFLEASELCKKAGGRLPNEDEWVAATAYDGTDASVHRAHRYPWGDTGAVCRRAAFGLVHGPCAEVAAAGADTVGAHPDGATGAGVFDLAGNVAEWVRTAHGEELRGGSYASAFAAEIRVWYREQPAQGARPAHAGARCVYDAP
jgi:formylglycine-generating enzyme required for sulfatase activity